MVVFGGFDGFPRNDIWVLSLAGTPAWGELSPSGTPPVERYIHTAIYDPVQERMVVFGGAAFGQDFGYYSDTWALSLAGAPAWSELTPSGTPPSARYAHTAIYDPVRDRMVAFGGYGEKDTWVLTLSGTPVWSELTPSGTLPPRLFHHTAIYDPVRDRMVVFGGFGTYDDTRVLSLSGTPAWSELTPSGTPPSGRHGHTAIYDPVRDRMVVFGGRDTLYHNDTWALSLAGAPAWSELTPSGTLPAELAYHTAIYDPVRDRMVVFGGYDGSYYNDTWALSLAGTPTWSELTPSGTPPSGPLCHTAIYDPVRDRWAVSLRG
jgi:hypothetical protein